MCSSDLSTSYAGVTVSLLNNTASGGEAQGDTISGFENVMGSEFADTLTGDARDNYIEGGAGADVLNGGAGRDTLSYYYATSGGVTVSLADGTGSRGDAAGDVFSNFENILGSTHDDVLSGDAGDNVLRGDNGDDSLFGGGGDDLLVGGRGNDVVDGGDGYDVLEVNGSREDYQLTEVDGGGAWMLKGLDGRDVLTGIEVIRFSDGSEIELLRMYAEQTQSPFPASGGDAVDDPRVLPASPDSAKSVLDDALVLPGLPAGIDPAADRMALPDHTLVTGPDGPMLFLPPMPVFDPPVDPWA